MTTVRRFFLGNQQNFHGDDVTIFFASARELEGCPVALTIVDHNTSVDEMERVLLEAFEGLPTSVLSIVVRGPALAPQEAIKRLGQEIIRYALGQVEKGETS